jgi:hypothetical protein
MFMWPVCRSVVVPFVVLPSWEAIKFSAFRRLRYYDLIIFIWEKASSLKYIDPKKIFQTKTC